MNLYINSLYIGIIQNYSFFMNRPRYLQMLDYNLIGWTSVIFLCGSTLCIWAIILIIKLIIKYEYILKIEYYI